MNKITKSFSILTLALATILSTGTVKAQASEQGHWDSKYTSYIVNGEYVKGWQKIGNFWYYFTSDGTYATETIIDGKYHVSFMGVWDGITLDTNTGNTNNIAKNATTAETISYAEFTKIADDKMLELVNAHREANGVQPMTWDQTLADMSTEKSEHMIKYNYTEHDYHGLATALVQAVGWDYHVPSENVLATSQTFNLTEEDAKTLGIVMFNQWKASPGHNRNMLDPDWIQFGFGFAFSNGKAQYASYGTQQFLDEYDLIRKPMQITDEKTGKDITNPTYDIGGIWNIK